MIPAPPFRAHDEERLLLFSLLFSLSRRQLLALDYWIQCDEHFKQRLREAIKLRIDIKGG